MTSPVPYSPPVPSHISTREYTMNGPQSRAGDRSSVSEIWTGDGNTPGGRASPRAPLKHFLDITALAQRRVTDIDIHVPMNFLLNEAGRALTDSDSLLTFKRSPDLSYIEYLVAYEIVVNRVPRHKDYAALQSDRGSLHRMYRELLKKIQNKEAQFSSIKEIIINDNRRCGIQPETKAAYDAEPSSRPSSANGREPRPYRHQPIDSIAAKGSHADFAYPSSDASKRLSLRPVTPNDTASGRSTPADSPPRSKPAVRPKPENLHGHAVGNGYALPSLGTKTTDPLRERFAGLRSGTAGDRSSQAGASPYPDEPLRIPSPSDFRPPAPFSPPSQASQGAQARPAGPRALPEANHCPPKPPKLPLDTGFNSALPKQPSPTYSPARNMATPASIPPPRTTPRSTVPSSTYNHALASTPHFEKASAHEGQGYFDARRHETVAPQRMRRTSTSAKFRDHITPNWLYDLIKISKVLIIDVRHRDAFDEGHLYALNVMCVEPSQLREGMSAEGLQDSLVLAPDEEQRYFAHRAKYDYVVYYDQDTPSTEFINRPPQTASERALKVLYDALLTYNESSPLKHTPLLLQGGLDAWISLLGPQSLLSSNTLRTKAIKASQPARPAPILPGSSPIADDKAHREVPELDEDEYREWLEQARREENLPVEPPPAPYEYEDTRAAPMARTTEEFFRRFPDVATLEGKQSMVSPPPRPQQPPSSLPSVPTRPAPIAPRVSYTGVHERESARYSAIRGPQQVFYDYTIIPQNIRLPRTGLINFSNNCFLNSIVQALSGTLRLSLFFRDGSYRKYIQSDNWKGSRGLVSQHLSNLLVNLWQNDVRAVRPSTFHKLMGRIAEKWASGQQQDAKEFFDVVMDLIHEDININWNNPPPHELTAAEELKKERIGRPFAAKIEWNRYIKRNESFISSLFGGQHASLLVCETCRNTSTSYEPFFSISVNIDKPGHSNLQRCIDAYCAPERLDPPTWKCPHCNAIRIATKQLVFTRAPEVLVVHFKRFRTELSMHGDMISTQKVKNAIDFPLNGLDLGRWMIPPPTPEETARNAKDRGPNDCALPPSMTPPYVYNAYAVVRHIGESVHSGHYVALVKNPGRNCWTTYNDTSVTEFKPELCRPPDHLQNRQAYLVFYERVHAR